MKLRILVADDTKFMRALMRDFLEQGGHQVVGEAVNGHEAVKMYEKQRPDVVFMDITMPELDGVAALEKILRINPSAIIIICSVMSQQELISEAIHKGAKGYIMKPFQPGQVEEAITNYALPHLQNHQMPSAIGSIVTTGEPDELYAPTPAAKSAPAKKFTENIVPMEQVKQNKQQAEEEQVRQEKRTAEEKPEVIPPVEQNAVEQVQEAQVQEVQVQEAQAQEVHAQEAQVQAQTPVETLNLLQLDASVQPVAQVEEQALQALQPLQNETANESFTELASLVMDTPVSSTEGQLEAVSEEWNVDAPLLPEELSLLLASTDTAEDLSTTAPVQQAAADEPVMQNAPVEEAGLKSVEAVHPQQVHESVVSPSPMPSHPTAPAPTTVPQAWQTANAVHAERNEGIQSEPAFSQKPLQDSYTMNAYHSIYEEPTALTRSGNHQDQPVHFTGGDFEMRGFSTHYQLQWQELFRGEEHADYTVLYREGEGRLSIKMSMNQSKQTVNISIVALRQLVKWIEPKLLMDMEGKA